MINHIKNLYLSISFWVVVFQVVLSIPTNEFQFIKMFIQSGTSKKLSIYDLLFLLERQLVYASTLHSGLQLIWNNRI